MQYPFTHPAALPVSPADELRRLQLEAARRVIEWHAKRLAAGSATAGR